jgi:uncharacterized protein (DUF433 family)
MSDWIDSNPGILGGKPCVRGTRISVHHILELLANGATLDEILRANPQITREGLLAAIQYAARALEGDALWEIKVLG